jgi:pimeloyl-ACP methyl ester carboxylesterase
VIAPDLRGYGRTTGWDDRYDAELSDFRMLNLVRDVIGLMHALGHKEAASVIGHDFGSPLAAWCATLRPELFRSVVLMSAPFGGPPPLPATGAVRPAVDVHEAMLALPRPRRHYQWYYATPEANAHMLQAPQGLSDFLRAYYHVKSADAGGERPYPLPAWDAESLARLPTYYVMDAGQTMPQTVAPHMPSREQVQACQWLPEADLAVYAAEYARTGFQGGLHWYRCNTSGRFLAEHQTWAGRRITIASAYIAGAMDWGIHQRPGEFDRMRNIQCTRMLECALLEGAGHWVQQEQHQATLQVLQRFLAVAAPA